MKKDRSLLKRLGALAAALTLTVSLWGCRTEGPETTGNTGGTTAATGEATQPTTQPVETTETATQMYWVFAYGGLRVRSGPGTGYQMVGSLEEGTVVEPLQWKDGWAYIKSPVEGWCSADYLHKLGWYKDVKTPEGTPPADSTLKGKWVHLSQIVDADGQKVCRAGVFYLQANGTFSHRVADFKKTADGKWEVVTAPADQPYWVGEYTFDGKTLVLSYMAELEETYDAKTGEPVTREWVEWVHSLTMEVTRDSGGMTFTITNGDQIPVTVGGACNATTLNTLYKATNAVNTPMDICAVLDKWFS